MNATEYKEIIRTIVKSAIKKQVPSLKGRVKEDLTDLIAKNIHARMYGANVDDVDSPLWQNENSVQPNIDAKELLK